ncbi:hypothetical protein VP01_1155g5 [Puccinia sorghi]|uniref:Uncharacterized protein n=1 Tax=Puccinia sorghi TaxID=27349 RepID=A0A0L6VRW5_9BASI|nr:hypothetical protein VP01_1155g5 [Puccinia sorghi]
MFSAKLLLAVLATVALTVKVDGSTGSQCAAWRNSFGRSPRPVIAKVMPAAEEQRLQRRITPDLPVKTVAGGPTSACYGKGYSTSFNDGVCLWNGASQTGAPPAGHFPGWLNGNYNGLENCGKRVYLDAPGKPRAQLKVIDGCTFGQNLTEEEGCSTIWLTQKSFNSLGGTGSTLKLNGWDL